jgi:hypothetical protein
VVASGSTSSTSGAIAVKPGTGGDSENGHSGSDLDFCFGSF